MDQWKGRVALVTGASSGIGRAVAATLGAHGMKVAVSARRRDRLEELARDIAEKSPGVEVLTHACDLRDVGQIDGLFAAVRERFGGVDVMVNNAGLGRKANLMDGETEHWREMLDVNVLALCVCTREAVRDMRSRGDDGHVIHIASIAGHRVPPASGVYSASKFAVRALTEGLRQELRDAESGIRVSAVSPGLVETGFAENYYGSSEANARVYGRFPVLQAEDIAETVRYLLSCPPHMQVHDVIMRPTRQPN